MSQIENAQDFACKCVEAALERGYSTAFKDIQNAYIAGFDEAEERHAKETGAIKAKAIEVYKRNCRTYTVCCFDKKPCTADCEHLSDFIEKLNER